MQGRAALAIIAVLVGACSAPATPTSAPPQATEAAPAGTPAAIPGGFDISRVRLMEASDLPEPVPVPVPFGGVIDTSMGTFDGRSLFVEYDPRFLATAKAFYAAWIQQEGLPASPLMTTGDGAGWEITIEGEPVRVQIALAPDGSATQLEILWD